MAGSVPADVLLQFYFKVMFSTQPPSALFGVVLLQGVHLALVGVALRAIGFFQGDHTSEMDLHRQFELLALLTELVLMITLQPVYHGLVFGVDTGQFRLVV